MPYRLEDTGNVPGEIRRIVEDQIERAVAEIDNQAIDDATAVHQVRKRCKKVRAVLRLGRGALEKDDTYGVENARFRDIARDLSMLRDAEVLLETHDKVAADISDPDARAECATLRVRLETYHERIAGRDADLHERLGTARTRLLAGRDRVAQWSRRMRGFRDLAPGLERTYRRGRRAMATAYKSGSVEAFHELRKRVKYHWYACRLLRDIWPAVMDARIGELSRLADLLGDEHDLSVYRATFASRPDWLGDDTRLPDMPAAAGARRDALRAEARALAMRLYVEKPGRLAARLKKYWASTQP